MLHHSVHKYSHLLPDSPHTTESKLDPIIILKPHTQKQLSFFEWIPYCTKSMPVFDCQNQLVAFIMPLFINTALFIMHLLLNKRKL